jgi:predicted DCC family thiol-disulfide oxidoreductase YuxK
MTDSRPYTMIFDGHCTVCGRIMSIFQRWDRRGQLEFLPSHDAEVAVRFPWISDAAFQGSVQLVGPDQTTWTGAAAMERAIDLMPKGAMVTWVFSIPFARPLAERFYRWFARNRYRLGCGDHCELKPR